MLIQSLAENLYRQVNMSNSICPSYVDHRICSKLLKWMELQFMNAYVIFSADRLAIICIICIPPVDYWCLLSMWEGSLVFHWVDLLLQSPYKNNHTMIPLYLKACLVCWEEIVWMLISNNPLVNLLWFLPSYSLCFLLSSPRVFLLFLLQKYLSLITTDTAEVFISTWHALQGMYDLR